MERGGWLLALACMIGLTVGCGGSVGDQPVADASPAAESPEEPESSGDGDDLPDDSSAGPEATVSAFLNAIKSGDQDTANAMLTTLAREKTAEQDMGLAPTESETATFEIGAVELPADGKGKLAHVVCKWTDIGEDGQPTTDEILWALRREKEGWRIGGMATQVFDDQPPVVLDFEDPEDMQRKQLLVEREMERRARTEMVGDGHE
ncbi:MAG: hypothetical protein ACREJM_13475, partial [Candidatus Saccharimonadales bacterium]